MDKDQLFKPRLAEREVEIDAGTVRVRALSRQEVLDMRELDAKDLARVDQVILAKAMVDPKITEEEVAQWQAAAAAGEIETVIDAISEISGLTELASKNAYKSVS